MEDDAECEEDSGEYGTDGYVETETGGASDGENEWYEERDMEDRIDGDLEDTTDGLAEKYTELDAEEALDGGIVPNADVNVEGKIDGAIE